MVRDRLEPLEIVNGEFYDRVIAAYEECAAAGISYDFTYNELTLYDE